jgi:DNA processing protein
MEERIYWLGFSLSHGIGPKRFSQLLTTFGTAKTAWNASLAEITEVIGTTHSKKLCDFKSELDLERYNKQLEAKDVWFATLFEDEYPLLLKKSHNPPFLLFGKGNKGVLSIPQTIGVVGTRRITSYGRQVTEMITSDMVRNDYCIVSGLALGVDSVAHETALKNNGRTIAVLGCGVDCCNPVSNQTLYNNILKSGSCIISEFPLSQPPTTGSFPSRNRIIAGISQAVVVTEGALDSGSLITAHDAIKDGREVFAVPGQIMSQLSKGPNELLKKGATLITSGEDILMHLGVASRKLRKKRDISGDTKEEQLIISILLDEELSFDNLRQKSEIETAELNVLLSMMEMKGYIHISDRGEYSLI